MDTTYSKKAFTVMELLVVITVMIIIVIWATNVNFNTSTTKQRLEIFTNRIVSEIETIRTNDLVGRAELEGSNLEIPERWIIEFSSDNNWKMETKLVNNLWNTKVIKTLNIEDWYSIDEIWCTHPTTGNYNITDNASIFFEKWKYYLNWIGCQWWHNLITIKTFFNWVDQEISFDIINWLIKK